MAEHLIIVAAVAYTIGHMIIGTIYEVIDTMRDRRAKKHPEGDRG